MQDMATDEDATHGSSENELVNQAYESLMNSNRGKQLRSGIEEGRAREKEEKEQEIAYFKDKVNLILEGDDETFLNKEMMQSLPDIIEQLFAKEENQTQRR
jgi:flagellar motor component MotA